MDLPSRHSKEIFVILNYVPALNLVLANARVDIFHSSYFVAPELITLQWESNPRLNGACPLTDRSAANDSLIILL